jgi:hypothetical protein
MECGIWEWQVCHDQKPVVCGYGATREIARFGGYADLLFLLSLGCDDLKDLRRQSGA